MMKLLGVAYPRWEAFLPAYGHSMPLERHTFIPFEEFSVGENLGPGRDSSQNGYVLGSAELKQNTQGILHLDNAGIAAQSPACQV